jgi:hypothetical protein
MKVLQAQNIKQNPAKKAEKQSVSKISLVDYVSTNNTAYARRLVTKYGLSPATNLNDLRNKLAYVVAKFGDEALRDVASIHPDKELILDVFGKYNMTGAKNENGEYSYQNACGCGMSGADGEKQCACGCGNNNKNDSEHSNMITNYREPLEQYVGADGNPVKILPNDGGALFIIVIFGALLAINGLGEIIKE